MNHQHSPPSNHWLNQQISRLETIENPMNFGTTHRGESWNPCLGCEVLKSHGELRNVNGMLEKKSFGWLKLCLGIFRG